MPLYTVLAPPTLFASDEPDPVAFVFVKDGFCWPGLFYPEIWVLFRRMWFVFLVTLILLAIVFAASFAFGGPLPWVFLVFAHVFFALQANAFRRWTLERRGYEMIGVAEGRRVGEAEIRFFHDRESPPRDPRQPPPSRLMSALGSVPRVPGRSGDEVVGLFPSPSGRS